MSNIEEVKAGLEAIKVKVANLKDRSTKLGQAREGLVRQQATLEQQQAQTLAELKELGFAPPDLEPATLEAFAEKASKSLTEAVASLEQTVTTAEALVGTNSSLLD